MPAPDFLLRCAAICSLVAALSGCLRNGPAPSNAAQSKIAAAHDSKQRIRFWWNDAERLMQNTRVAFVRVQRAAKNGSGPRIDGTITTTQMQADAARYRVTTYVPDGLGDASNDLFTAFSEYETALNLVAESQNRDAQASLASAQEHASAGESALRSASRETLAEYLRAGGRRADIAAI